MDRDQALAIVEEFADPAWFQMALDTLERYLTTHPAMHVDRFWADTRLDQPRDARALGAVFATARRRHWMVKSGTVAPSARSHGSDKPVWRSLLYRA